MEIDELNRQHKCITEYIYVVYTCDQNKKYICVYIYNHQQIPDLSEKRTY
jgi:hypothetical protein